MWQPNTAQWRIIWIIALLLILAWPPSDGRSLGVKMTNWLADPRDVLPPLPEPLPINLSDNGDAVAEHDALTAEYYRQYTSSTVTRWRMKLKDAGDPFEPITERQVLLGIGLLGILLVWRLNGKA